VRTGADRHKSYIAVVVDAEGKRYEYVSFARNRRTAKKEVRASAGDWGATLVAIEPVLTRKRSQRRELFLAGITFCLSALVISAMMLLGLAVEGLLDDVGRGLP